MRKEKLAAIGSVAAAIAASICCIGPLVAVVLGLGSLAGASALEKWRPWFLALTFALLAFAWFSSYRKVREKCVDGAACAKTSVANWSRPVLWIATGFAIAFAAFPLYSGAVARILQRNSANASHLRASDLTTLQVKIPSMDCPACAVNIQRTLLKRKGIQSAQVDFATKQAVVRYDRATLSAREVMAAINETGFKAEPETNQEKHE